MASTTSPEECREMDKGCFKTGSTACRKRWRLWSSIYVSYGISSNYGGIFVFICTAFQSAITARVGVQGGSSFVLWKGKMWTLYHVWCTTWKTAGLFAWKQDMMIVLPRAGTIRTRIRKNTINHHSPSILFRSFVKSHAQASRYPPTCWLNGYVFPTRRSAWKLSTP